MQAILRAIMLLALTGFTASAIVHALAVAGVPSPFGPATWVLHVGIFAVWIPTILVAQRLTKTAKQSDFWKAAFRGCPPWVRVGAYLLAGYAALNFILFVVSTGQYPKNEVPDVVNYRGFSGHWMVFYYLATATLYSAIRLGGVGQPRCRNGHEVSPFANYCEICGVELQSSSVP